LEYKSENRTSLETIMLISMKNSDFNSNTVNSKARVLGSQKKSNIQLDREGDMWMTQLRGRKQCFG